MYTYLKIVLIFCILVSLPIIAQDAGNKDKSEADKSSPSRDKPEVDKSVDRGQKGEARGTENGKDQNDSKSDYDRVVDKVRKNFTKENNGWISIGKGKFRPAINTRGAVGVSFGDKDRSSKGNSSGGKSSSSGRSSGAVDNRP